MIINAVVARKRDIQVSGITSRTATNVVLQNQNNINASTNGTAGIIETTVPVTLKNYPTIVSDSTQSVSELQDVNILAAVDGATLIYDESTNTYIVKRLVFDDIDGTYNVDLDGGSF